MLVLSIDSYSNREQAKESLKGAMQLKDILFLYNWYSTQFNDWCDSAKKES